MTYDARNGRIGMAMPANIDFKDLAALVPLLAAIFTYFKTSHDRLARANRLAREYRLGWIYSLANIWPHRIHATVTALIMFASVGYFAIKFAGDLKSVRYVGPLLVWISEYYWLLFVVWLGFVVFSYFQIIERSVLWFLGRFPASHNTVDWANANWHIAEDGPEAPVLAPSADGLTKMVNKVIDDLVHDPPNPNLALRPAGLDNAVAANILYFGHVIEAYTTATGGPRFPWTPFYEALAKVSALPSRPFTSESISKFDPASMSFMDDVLMHLNDYVDPYFPNLQNDPALEERVTGALRVLKEAFHSDARNVARGRFTNSYAALLRNSQQFLTLEEMRRQFAKLATIWQVVDHLHRPAIFRTPFSGGIFLLYLNSDLLQTESERFFRDDAGVQICFEDTQRRLMQRVQSLVDVSLQPARMRWREAEMKSIMARGIDWRWWIYYRADQHAYHLGRATQHKPWTSINNGNTFVK
jgi:hypothetical protein